MPNNTQNNLSIRTPVLPVNPSNSLLGSVFSQMGLPNSKFPSGMLFPHMSPTSSPQQVAAHNATTPPSRTQFPLRSTSYSGANSMKPSMGGQMTSSPGNLIRGVQGFNAPTSYNTSGAGRTFGGGGFGGANGTRGAGTGMQGGKTVEDVENTWR